MINELPPELLELFKDSPNAPKRLFYRGNLELLKLPKVAIIGSRKASVYTKNAVLELSHKLAKAGVCVVSGGALGVDIVASRGAMPLSIGIFANSLDQIYPKTNELIIRQIYKNALAISEKELNYMPTNYDFLLRNRLIIGLSSAIVIAQADMKSGSMQSARVAKQCQKPIFVLPQRLNESEGTNLLLAKNEAGLIINFDDFVSKFSQAKEEQEIVNDEIIEFCKGGVSLDEALAKFGDAIYEYELLGKLEINGLFIRVLQ